MAGWKTPLFVVLLAALLVVCQTDAQPVPCEDGAVRLVDETAPNSGRVEFCVRGRWGTVCSDGWDANDAEVVCRQLGLPQNYSRAIHDYGGGRGPIFLDDVSCLGNETTLADCFHNGIGIHNCQHFEDAGVSCLVEPCTEGEYQCAFETQLGENEVPCIPEEYVCDGFIDCINGADEENCTGIKLCVRGDIRLVGPRPNTGILEICYNETWGTVCDDGFGEADVAVVCRQLGYRRGDILLDAAGGREHLPIHLDQVNCTGQEEALLECPAPPIGVHDCVHPEDVRITCTNEPLCFEGDIRLVDGRFPQEGIVEICFNTLWNSICDNLWSVEDVEVACMQLGLYTNYIEAYQGLFSLRPSLLDNFECNGTEENLLECSYSQNNCSAGQQAGLFCDVCREGEIPCPGTEDSPVCSLLCDGVNQCPGGIDEWHCECITGHIRLVNNGTVVAETNSGPGSNFEYGHGTKTISEGRVEGRVDVCYEGRWGTVCDDSWDELDAEVVCTQLGYQKQGSVAFSKAAFGPGTGPIWLDDVDCVGDEDTIFDCYSFPGEQTCEHYEDASVGCSLPATLTLLPVGRGDSVIEGGDGFVEVCVAVESGTLDGEITIVVSSGSGTARVGYDYTEIIGNITLYPEDKLVCVLFDAILDENIFEDTETFAVSIHQLGNATRANLEQSYRIVTIVDNEIVYIGFNQSSYTVAEGDGVMDVCVELLGDEGSYVLGKPLSVRLSSDGETAKAGVDFIPITQITYVPPGSKPGGRTCVSIPIIDDSVEEQTEALTLHLFACDTAVVMTNDFAVGAILDDDRDMPTPSAVIPTPITDTPSTTTPLPTETPPSPAALEVYFAESTPHIEGTTVSFIPNTNLPARLSCRLGQENYDCRAGETTVITGLTPGETYTLRLVATSDGDHARSSISIHIPAHSGSCYVHFTNRGVQLMENGTVLVNFGSAGPVTSYTCSLDRGPEETCTHPYLLSGLSTGRHRLVITPVGPMCTDVESLPHTFNT